MEKIRLSKLMSEQGLCSRREADDYIAKGWVKVDGETVSALPLSRVNEDELQLHELEFETAKLLSVLINSGSLPIPLHINMEEGSN